MEHSKFSKKNKDYSEVSKSHKDTQKRSDKPAKCWLYPQTRVRIVSKDYKKGKYYNKKVLVSALILSFFPELLYFLEFRRRESHN